MFEMRHLSVRITVSVTILVTDKFPGLTLGLVFQNCMKQAALIKLAKLKPTINVVQISITKLTALLGIIRFIRLLAWLNKCAKLYY